MEALERENEARIASGVKPRPLHPAWVSRPRLNAAEHGLWAEFMRFARFCGWDPRPTDALAWFELRDVSRAERVWMADLFGAMSTVLRERTDNG